MRSESEQLTDRTLRVVSQAEVERKVRARLAERPRVCPYDDPFRAHAETCVCKGSGLATIPPPSDEARLMEAEPIPVEDPRGDRPSYIEGYDR